MNKSRFQDPLEMAFSDYLSGDESATIVINSNKTTPEEVAVEYFFRSFNEMPKLEQKALSLCRGRVLDVGAGAGSHSLFLQQEGVDVKALEIKQGLVEIMKIRGVNKVVHSDIYKFGNETFDTLLLMMNGIGFTANFKGLEEFLQHSRKLLNQGGQIILDSSDILYLYEEEDGSYLIDLNENYYGQVEYYFEYKGMKGEKFNWLFIDFHQLMTFAEEAGFNCELIFEDEHYNYLAQLTKR